MTIFFKVKNVSMLACIVLCFTYSTVGESKDKPFGWTLKKTASQDQAQSLGSYAYGCLQGASQLPEKGEGYQSIRRYRNRYYAHPITIKLIEKFGRMSKKAGLLPMELGDLSQPRGGRMSYGHKSHQTGLDVDVWFGGDSNYNKTILPKRMKKLEKKAKKKGWSKKKFARARFDVEHPSLIKGAREVIDEKVWSQRHENLLELAAKNSEVARIFIHFRIKEKMCALYQARSEAKRIPEPLWLRKLRPWYGHHQHFHIRLHCPKDSPYCENQGPLPKGLGCEGLEWFSIKEQRKRKKESRRKDQTHKEELAKLSRAERRKLKAEKAQKKKEKQEATAQKKQNLIKLCAHLGE